MRISTLLLPVPLILLGACCSPKSAASPKDQALAAEATKFVADMDKELRTVLVGAALAQWTNATDITDAHEAAESAANSVQNDAIAKLIKTARKYEPILDQLDPSTRRQLQVLIYITTVATPVAPSPDDPAQATELAKVATEMGSIYGKGKVCEGTDCKDLDALSKVLQSSRDPNAELAAWKGWHDTVGHQERDLFVKYVGLANAGAKAIGFTDVAQMWKSAYDMPADAFEAETDRLFNQLKPLYTQLHCYARKKLNGIYGDAVVPKTGPMPAHLLGNMWAQSWDWMYKEFEPYPGEATIDVTPTIAAKLDDKGMVRLGEAFYTSLGMPPLPQTFWERSMFQKPPGKDAVCHASAWDVQFNGDLRIKMCIEKTQEDLVTIHHELGHDYYFAAYHTLPIVLQQGANDGFHEAIGDTVALSVTPGYLTSIGLLDREPAGDTDVAELLQAALDKVAFLPFGVVIDQWRWQVFSGAVPPERYNAAWWELIRRYQGMQPPVPRSEADFDPGAKYHVPANVPYTRYFLADILQYQFHKSLCDAAGYRGPLHRCSIYGNATVGERLRAALAMGQSRPWPDVMEALTGQRAMDATAMVEYFAPLKRWLDEQNRGVPVGW